MASLRDPLTLEAARERLAFKDEQIAELKEENNQMREEIGVLKAENSQLKERLALVEIPDHFTMHNGVLWKRKSGGGYEKMPYCPKCKYVMHSFGMDPAVCTKCSIHAHDITQPK